MFSVLNPEAPEFYPHGAAIPHVTATTQNGLKAVVKSVKASNLFPSGTSLDTFKTFTDFNIISCQLSENVINQSNKILSCETRVMKLKCNDNEHNTERVVEANDNFLDRVNTNIDVQCGITKPMDSSISGPKNPLNHVSSWNNSPVIAKVQIGSATLIGAKNIPRPQIHFKDSINNSDSLWVPKISDKPNNIKPLALNILYNENGEAVGYEHPYKVELELYQPPAQFLDLSPEPPVFPRSLAETPLTFVDTEPELDRLVAHLHEVSEIAVDVEHHSYRTYHGITCLIQLTTDEGGDFIVDTLALREHMHKLNASFTDPKKLKVFHGAEMDVIWLQRDFGVYVVGLFDTHQAAKVLKLNGLSLKHLLMRYCHVDADKKYQLADWRMRPLPEELVAYARADTHYLLYMWRRMRDELVRADDQPRLLRAAFEQSRQVCGLTYNKEVLHETSHIPLYRKSNKAFNSQQMAALKLLFKWRDTQARELDESTAYLLPNHMLLTLAETLPREVQGVNACCSPMPPFVKQNLITIHRMLLSCRELPLEPQLYRMPLSINTMLNHQRTANYNCHDLSHAPDFRDDLPVALKTKITLQPSGDHRLFSPDVKVFVPQAETEQQHPCIVSGLNADAKSFIPPFERYKKYRSLAQIEEIKEFKEKEAKIAAIGKGDELIKNEVLSKFQDTTKSFSNAEVAPQATDDCAQQKTQRKRKAPENCEKNEIESRPEATLVKTEKEPVTKNKPKTDTQKYHHVKPFEYKNANYKKFYDDSGVHRLPANKQSKAKFKKHKK